MRRWSHISICATVEFEPNEYKGAKAIIDFMIAISAVKKADAVRSHFSSMQSTLESNVFKEWTESRKLSLLRVVGEAVGTCCKPKV